MIEELRALVVRPDGEIDVSDIPELDDSFWKAARLVEPDPSEHVTLGVRTSALEAFKAQGKGYTSRMSAVLDLMPGPS